MSKIYILSCHWTYYNCCTYSHIFIFLVWGWLDVTSIKKVYFSESTNIFVLWNLILWSLIRPQTPSHIYNGHHMCSTPFFFSKNQSWLSYFRWNIFQFFSLLSEFLLNLIMNKDDSNCSWVNILNGKLWGNGDAANVCFHLCRTRSENVWISKFVSTYLLIESRTNCLKT